MLFTFLFHGIYIIGFTYGGRVINESDMYLPEIFKYLKFKAINYNQYRCTSR